MQRQRSHQSLLTAPFISRVINGPPPIGHIVACCSLYLSRPSHTFLSSTSFCRLAQVAGNPHKLAWSRILSLKRVWISWACAIHSMICDEFQSLTFQARKNEYPPQNTKPKGPSTGDQGLRTGAQAPDLAQNIKHVVCQVVFDPKHGISELKLVPCGNKQSVVLL